MEKVAVEVAQKEVDEWLDFIDVSSRDREKKMDSIEVLIDAVVDGKIVINPDKTITQTLRHPLGEDEDVKTLTFKSRLNLDTLSITMQGIKQTDLIGLMCAQVSALTGVSRNVIRKMNSKDFAIGQAIYGFF